VSWVDSTDELKTEIWLVNTSSETTIVETGPCAFNVMAYTISDENPELVWYNIMPENYVCPEVLYTYRIPPQDTVILESQLYISGNNWQKRVPHGEWRFVLEAKTEDEHPSLLMQIH
jgi:protocatechuate 3,4-dioxygenase beta subunit